MNNRDYKQFASGAYYHLYNRGTGKMNIFRDKEDYALLLLRLREALFPASIKRHHKRGEYQRKELPSGAFTLICYALMPNHYHLLLRQNSETSVSTLMLNVFGGYSKCFNKKYDRVGALFQDQFKAAQVDSNEYLLWLSAYIHANPKVAGLTEDLASYPYTSYPDFVNMRNETLCDMSVVREQFRDVIEYARFVESATEQISERKDVEHLLIDAA